MRMRVYISMFVSENGLGVRVPVFVFHVLPTHFTSNFYFREVLITGVFENFPNVLLTQEATSRLRRPSRTDDAATLAHAARVLNFILVVVSLR